MHLANLQIEKIIIHQVFAKDSDGKSPSPLQSHELINFDPLALEAFKSRVREALGSDSKAVQMEIIASGASELPTLVDTMIDQDTKTFIVSSFDIALKLAKAQFSKGIPGGIVVVFTGTQGVPAKRFLGIIKADVYSAYEKIVNKKTGQISLNFVKEVLLTPATKLYKTAGFFENISYNPKKYTLSDRWKVMVSDHQISNSEINAAARYFYRDFLGCGYLKSSARTTKLFFDETKNFISDLEIPSDEKVELMSALTVYLKVQTSATVSTDDFSKTYFYDPKVQDEYGEYMAEKGVPVIAFTKDIKHIEKELKTRRIKFGASVSIRASAEALKELVEITSITGEKDETGFAAEWTNVVIRHKVTSQE